MLFSRRLNPAGGKEIVIKKPQTRTVCGCIWWRVADLNRRPSACEKTRHLKNTERTGTFKAPNTLSLILSLNAILIHLVNILYQSSVVYQRNTYHVLQQHSHHLRHRQPRRYRRVERPDFPADREIKNPPQKRRRKRLLNGLPLKVQSVWTDVQIPGPYYGSKLYFYGRKDFLQILIHGHLE